MSNRQITYLASALWPVAGFPIFFFISISYDTLWGDRLLLFTLKHGSRSELLWTTLSDWWHALPVSYGLALVVGMLVFAWRRWRNRYTHTFFAACSAIGCALAAYFGTGQINPIAGIALLSGAAWALSLGMLIKWTNQSKQ